MSRSDAKRTFDLDKFKDDMKGIYSTSVCRRTLDECPDAYKDPMLIEQAIEPTATIIDRIKPIHNMKDASSSDNKHKKHHHDQVVDDVDDNIVD
jgi:hypothetical protein